MLFLAPISGTTAQVRNRIIRVSGEWHIGWLAGEYPVTGIGAHGTPQQQCHAEWRVKHKMTHQGWCRGGPPAGVVRPVVAQRPQLLPRIKARQDVNSTVTNKG